VKAGKKIAVVSTASTLDSDGTRLYSASANQAFSKQSVEFLNGMRVSQTVYGEAVVNEGESFLYSSGQWIDWSKHIAALPKSTEKFASVAPFPGDTYIEQFPIDNFSIKLYAVPEPEPEPAKQGWEQLERDTWVYYTDGELTFDGWMKDSGKWYYLVDGVMKTGWLCDKDGKWYFLETRHNGHFGAMVASGWIWDAGHWYYLGWDGAMLHNTTTPDGYRVDANGAWIA
jgi:hypothetical protein